MSVFNGLVQKYPKGQFLKYGISRKRYAVFLLYHENHVIVAESKRL